MASPRDNMDCRSARSLVSEALDQRLGQAEARAFRSHLLACQRCRRVFDEMRRVQSTTHDLPDVPVSHDFKQRLLHRIAAGEGSPPAILRGPVPIAHRVKLFASGAATAAALLLSAWLIMDGLSEPEPDAAPPNTSNRQLVNAPVSWNSSAIAATTVTNSASMLHRLQQEAPQLLKLPPNNAREKLYNPSRDIRVSLRLIRAMSPDVLELELPYRTSIEQAELKLARILNDLSHAAKPSCSRQDIERAVRIVGQIKLESPRVRLRVERNRKPEIHDVLRKMVRHPEEIHDVWLTLRRVIRQANGENSLFFVVPQAR